MLDSFKHQGLRKRLVALLKDKGISNSRVLAAIEKVPRHLYMDNSFVSHAYEDKAFPIGADQTISQPYTVAVQSGLLEVQPGESILEIGTGSGYQTAVLVELGAKVYSIERQRSLYLKTKMLLDKMGYRADLKFGDGFRGWPSFAPFDKIIVTCGAPFVPEDLKKQLKVGGKMVIPVSQKAGSEKMIVLHKQSEDVFDTSENGDFRFVPMLEKRNL